MTLAAADKFSDAQQILQASFDVAKQAIKTSVELVDPTINVDTANKPAVGHFTNVYTSTNVTTGAYVLLGTTAADATEIEIFDSSGQSLVLAFGTSDQVYIFPGGNGRIPLKVPTGTVLQIKAVSGTANAGFILVNLYGVGS